MTQQAKFERSDAAVWPYACQLHGQAWLEKQAALAGDAQRMMAAWASRRQDGLAATCQAARELWVCKDITAATTVYNDWWGGVVRRALADMTDAGDEMLRLSEASQRAMTALSATAVEATQIHA